jgi:hypothetical protein
MFGWFKSERRERQKIVRQDRKHLEERVRRFLKGYLDLCYAHRLPGARDGRAYLFLGRA